MPKQEPLISLKDLPSPQGHFLLGHLPEFRKNTNKHQVLEKWVQECGKLLKVNFAGTKLIVSADPEINHQILSQRPEKFRRLSRMTDIIREMGVISVFNAEGETWRRHRIPIARALNVRRIKTYYPVLREKTLAVIEKFGHYAAAGEAIAVQKEFVLFTVELTTAIAFGYKMDMINERSDAFQSHLENIFPMINERISAPVPLWRFYKKKKDRQLETSLKFIEAIVHRFIGEARDRIQQDPSLQENPTNLLESLLVEQAENHFSDEEIYGNVFAMLLAGEDTTSNSISWLMFYLAQHPDIVQKIREEAIRVYGEAAVPPDHEQLSQLTYTHAVVQEALRIKPTTPQLYLEANEDVVVGKLQIAKDTGIILQNKVPQTAEQNFTEAEAFIPERWLEGGCPAHRAHSPEVIKTFGGGPRFCPGKYLATNEMLIMISALCKRFTFELAVAPDTVREQFEFTMYPENLWVKFRGR